MQAKEDNGRLFMHKTSENIHQLRIFFAETKNKGTRGTVLFQLVANDV